MLSSNDSTTHVGQILLMTLSKSFNNEQVSLGVWWIEFNTRPRGLLKRTGPLGRNNGYDVRTLMHVILNLRHDVMVVMARPRNSMTRSPFSPGRYSSMLILGGEGRLENPALEAASSFIESPSQ